MAEIAPLVGVIMGSASDWPTMQHAAATLAEFGVPHECQVVSAQTTLPVLGVPAHSKLTVCPPFFRVSA